MIGGVLEWLGLRAPARARVPALPPLHAVLRRSACRLELGPTGARATLAFDVFGAGDLDELPPEARGAVLNRAARHPGIPAVGARLDGDGVAVLRSGAAELVCHEIRAMPGDPSDPVAGADPPPIRVVVELREPAAGEIVNLSPEARP